MLLFAVPFLVVANVLLITSCVGMAVTLFVNGGAQKP